MKQQTLFTLLFTFCFIHLFGQYAAVQYDMEKNYFNEGQYLPAEKPLMFGGLVPEGVDIIEISIFPANAKKESHKLYHASWKSFDKKIEGNFSTAINFPLRASTEYDFRIDYFQKVRPSERTDLTNRLIDLAKSYLASTLTLRGNSISIAKKNKQIIKDLNEIIFETLSEYRTQNANTFDGFSVTLEQKLEQLENLSLVRKQEDTTAATRQDRRQNNYRNKLKEIEDVVEVEIEQLMDKNWSKLSTSRLVDNYRTEARKGSFKLNVGYGAVYIGGNLDNLDYDTAPYVGVSFPLGNGTLAAQVFRNSSITIGAFLENFEDVNGNTITGFLVDRPIYLGLDYKLFEFIRFNAGAAFLERETSSMNQGIETIQTDVLIKPFIGLSARIELGIGFGK